MALRAILTGATGLVGEGVLLECFDNPAVESVLVVGRRSCGRTHAKLTELIAPDFTKLEAIEGQLRGYDVCLYCAGISSRGLNETEYSRITYDTPLHFAQVLLRLNPQMVMCHVSGAHTDGSEQGRVMWARVKGRAENALMKLPFKGVYNFRPGFMKPTDGQQNVKAYYRIFGAVIPLVLPGLSCTMREVARSMINAAVKGAPKQVLEVADLKALAA
jgi:uncharacterized protein YbjT (DUF2867 family)